MYDLDVTEIKIESSHYYVTIGRHSALALESKWTMGIMIADSVSAFSLIGHSISLLFITIKPLTME